MKSIATATWWLQMTEKPVLDHPMPAGYQVRSLPDPDIGFYRFLYTSVGKNYNWFDRLLMREEELLAIIHSPDTEVVVLYHNENPAGFAEVSRALPEEPELVYFGLFPAYTGRNLGTPFLTAVIDRVFQKPVTRFWLHTCDLDHMAALRLYQKLGFTIYHSEVVQQPVPEDADNPYLTLPW